MTLTDFLLARIAEDEARARQAAPEKRGAWIAAAYRWARSHPTRSVALHPTAAPNLAECKAKRRLVALHPTFIYTDEEPGFNVELNDHPCPGGMAPCLTLRLLALPYADHPDHDERWRPEPAAKAERP